MRIDRKSAWMSFLAMPLLLLAIEDSVAGESDNGRRLAEQWCSGCHMVSAEQQQASDAAPSFAEIAASGLDEAALETFLGDPTHSRMPDLALSRSEISSLIAYIKRQAP